VKIGHKNCADKSERHLIPYYTEPAIYGNLVVNSIKIGNKSSPKNHLGWSLKGLIKYAMTDI